MSELRLWSVIVALAGSGACSSPRPLAAPASGAELAGARDAGALVRYLSQPAADPSVCDRASPGPHIAIDDEIERALVDAIRTGKLAPDPWRACVDQIFATGSEGRRTSLLDRIAQAYTAVLSESAIERDSRIQARLTALEGAYRERAPDVAASAEAITALTAQLRQRLDGGKLGPFARRSATELLATLGVERGMWNQRLVDAALLDQLVAQRDEQLLARFAARLPAAQRGDAQRRLIRLRIAASPYPEVRDDAARVEEIVMQHGRNPVALAQHAPTSAQIDAAQLPLRGLVVNQDMDRQRASFGDTEQPAGAPMVAPVALQDALTVELAGLSRPVALCRSAQALDPTPCLLPSDVAVNSSLVWRDRDGGVHFVEQFRAVQAIDLARRGERLQLPISIAGAVETQLEWPLTFARPDDLLFVSDAPRGAALAVAIEERHGRLIYEVEDRERLQLAVVERADASGFRIVNRGSEGAAGADGEPGEVGRDGAKGTKATCQIWSDDGERGRDGGDGGDGRDGRNGGDGGDIRVVVRCESGICDHTIAMLRPVIRSEGGPGGAGGRGGTGGAGGRGGDGGEGERCVNAKGDVMRMPAGASGAAGASGNDGRAGRDGSVGRPGRVAFIAERITK